VLLARQARGGRLDCADLRGHIGTREPIGQESLELRSGPVRGCFDQPVRSVIAEVGSEHDHGAEMEPAGSDGDEKRGEAACGAGGMNALVGRFL